MVQLVEQLLLIPEVRGSTPVIGKIYIEHLFVYLFIINCIEKTKINKKRPGIAHLLFTFFFSQDKYRANSGCNDKALIACLGRKMIG